MTEPSLTKHVETTVAKTQVELAKDGDTVFSHATSLPLTVWATGWFWNQKIFVTTTEPVWYRDAVTTIEIPAQFTCDLASIPVCLWWIVSPVALAMEGLFHDYGYREQKKGISRMYVDFMMLNMMAIRGVPVFIRYPVWAAVRLFGGRAWRKNALDKQQRTDLGPGDNSPGG